MCCQIRSEEGSLGTAGDRCLLGAPGVVVVFEKVIEHMIHLYILLHGVNYHFGSVCKKRLYSTKL